MKLKVLFGIMLSILSLTIVGCGGGGSSAPVSTTVSGEASKGPIIGGDVKFFAIKADGSVQPTPLPTTPATVTTRAPFGNYSAVIGYAGPVKIEVKGNIGSKYRDEATDTDVDFFGKTLSAVVANVSGSAKVAVTPFTDLAVRTAGVFTPANIDKANLAVANSLGLHEVDIIKESPSKSDRYKFALAVISQAAGTSPNGLTNKLSELANAIDVNTGTIKTPAVGSDFAAASAAAFQNIKINPTGSIPGVDPAEVTEVKLSVPAAVQQIGTQVAITATVRRLDGALSANTPVDFNVNTGSAGTFSAASAITDANGVAIINLTTPAEETVTFSAHAHPSFASNSVVFADLNKPATVTLKADQLQGITKGQGPVNLSATVTRFGFGLVGPGLGSDGPKFVPDGTVVTFNTSGTGGSVSSNTAVTSGGVATVALNSTTAGNIATTATAGTITSAPAVNVLFIDQPVTATLKFVTSGTLPAGVTKISTLIGNLSITPAGVTVKTLANANSATGISVNSAVMSLSGVTPSNAFMLPTEVTLATATTPTKVLVPLQSFTGGFDIGEFATIVTDIAKGTFPTKSDFVLSGFKAIGLDANGAQVILPNVTVDFVLSLQ